MAFYWTENRPNKHSARRAWEKSWEDDFTRNFRALGQFRGNLLSLMPANLIAANSNDNNIIQLEEEIAMLCQLQQDMAKEAAVQFSEQNFEEKWKGLSQCKREEVVLEGIYRTMCLPDMEERRQWCPDSSLKNLASRNGDEYLRILRGLLPDTLNARFSEPQHIPHAVVDRLFTPTAEQKKKPGQITMFRTFRTSRTYALTHVIWNIFLAFIGREETQLPVKQFRGVLQNEDFVKAVPEFKDIVRESNAQRKGLEYACRTCGLTESRLEDGKKLLACGKCRKIGRKVFYCSKECQTKDWREGVPRPHKTICGKLLSEEELEDAPPFPTTDELDNESLLPPPDAGYKRSPALMQQVSLLSENTNLDYVVVYPYPQPDQGIGIGMNKRNEKLYFIVQRNRAFRNGDPQAVDAMYALLCPSADRSGISRAKIHRQLESEFGTTVSMKAPVQEAMAIKPTQDELTLAHKSIKRQMIMRMLGGPF